MLEYLWMGDVVREAKLPAELPVVHNEKNLGGENVVSHPRADRQALLEGITSSS